MHANRYILAVMALGFALPGVETRAAQAQQDRSRSATQERENQERKNQERSNQERADQKRANQDRATQDRARQDRDRRASRNGQTLDDPAIRDAIEQEYQFDDAVRIDDVDVKVADGVVTLSGKVPSLMAKERAVGLAETVRGVRSVEDQLKVRAMKDRSGSDLKSDIKSALLKDPATDSYEVGVSADDRGVVTLTGIVQSWQERSLSEMVAKSVRGVTDIRNDIKVNYQSQRPDVEIQADIQRGLEWDSLVDAGMVDVKVQDGNVILSGTVGSAAEKRRARMEAWVAGVNSVDASGLKADRWNRDADFRVTSKASSDEDLQRAVEEALVVNPRVFSFDVRTEVSDGQVTLRGTVDNLKAKRAAENEARNTVGVTAVRNRIKVRPEGEIPANQVISDIIDGLKRSPFVDRHDIMVSVVDGTAYLSGTVDSYFEKGEADDIASRVPGVQVVRNYLDVGYVNGALTYDPYVDDWYAYGYDWYGMRPYASLKSDRLIQDDIHDEMWWSPFVDADDVTVRVNDGVATLTGEVDSWSELRAATENAFEGGARWVRNDLEVD